MSLGQDLVVKGSESDSQWNSRFELQATMLQASFGGSRQGRLMDLHQSHAIPPYRSGSGKGPVILGRPGSVQELGGDADESGVGFLGELESPYDTKRG